MTKKEREKLEREFFEALDRHQWTCMRPDSTFLDLGFSRARLVAAFFTVLDRVPTDNKP